MNPRLVACLIASMLLGVVVAGVAVVAGWGVAVAVAAYSLSGSASLLLAAVAGATVAPAFYSAAQTGPMVA